MLGPLCSVVVGLLTIIWLSLRTQLRRVQCRVMPAPRLVSRKAMFLFLPIVPMTLKTRLISRGVRFTEGLLSRTALGCDTSVWFTVITRRLLFEAQLVRDWWCLPRWGKQVQITLRLCWTVVDLLAWAQVLASRPLLMARRLK